MYVLYEKQKPDRNRRRRQIAGWLEATFVPNPAASAARLTGAGGCEGVFHVRSITGL